MIVKWFAHPWGLVLLGFLPLLALLGWYSRRRRRRVLEQFGSREILQRLLIASPAGLWLRFALLGLGLGLLIVGLAGPQWGRDWSQEIAPGRDLVVVFDLSRSMLAEQPSRLDRARTALADLVHTLKEQGGHRVGLVVFAGRARTVCPLTNDYDHFQEAIANLDKQHLPSGISATEDEPSGTRLGAALREALALHDPGFQGFQDILVLSDGDDPARDEEWRRPAAEVQARRIPISTVGLGDPDHASPIPVGKGQWLEHQGQVVLTRLQEDPLRTIADMTGGSFIEARTRSLPLGKIFHQRLESRPVNEDQDDRLPQYRQRYPWFLSPALLLLAGGLVLELRWRRRREKVVQEKLLETAA
jgi:Ca-activated chloride channel family protein